MTVYLNVVNLSQRWGIIKLLRNTFSNVSWDGKRGFFLIIGVASESNQIVRLKQKRIVLKCEMLLVVVFLLKCCKRCFWVSLVNEAGCIFHLFKISRILSCNPCCLHSMRWANISCLPKHSTCTQVVQCGYSIGLSAT